VLGAALVEHLDGIHRRYGVRHLDDRRDASHERSKRGVREVLLVCHAGVPGVHMGVDKPGKDQLLRSVERLVYPDLDVAVEQRRDPPVLTEDVDLLDALRGDDRTIHNQ